MARPLFNFPRDRKPIRGTRIDELANKFRTASLSCNNIAVAQEYLASKFRSELLIAFYYEEGYIAPEEMEESLKRINGPEGYHGPARKAFSHQQAAGAQPIRFRIADFTSATEYIFFVRDPSIGSPDGWPWRSLPKRVCDPHTE